VNDLFWVWWCDRLWDNLIVSDEARFKEALNKGILPLIEDKVFKILSECSGNHTWRAERVLQRASAIHNDPYRACDLLSAILDLSCDRAFIAEFHNDIYREDQIMSCTISPASVITREGNLWVIDGKTKVSDLDQCKTLKSIPKSDVEAAPSEPLSPVVIQPPPQPIVQTQPIVQQPSQDPLELDLVQVIRLAGDNVWLAALLVMAVLAKKYIDKLELSKATQEQLNSQCHERHQEALNQVGTINQGLSNVTREAKELDSKVRGELGKQMSDLEKRLLAVEMELRYQKPAASPVGRPKKNPTEDNT